MIKYQEVEVKEDLLNEKDLFELGLNGKANSKDLRNIVSLKFHLGPVNSKSLLKRLNMLGIDKNTLKEVLNEHR